MDLPLTSQLENKEDILSKMKNLQCQTEISNFDFENNQHPLLITTVLKEIFKNFSIADLKKSRLVCKDWNLEALRLLKKIEWKSPTQFEDIFRLYPFVSTFTPCPENILNQNLDCGQILVPSVHPPEAVFNQLLPVSSCIKGLKVNINIQQERTFIAHETFQHFASTLKTFDVRFIKNDNISLTPDSVYPPTQLPSLPALTSVIIRMDGFVKYRDRIVHPEYQSPYYPGQKDFVAIESEHRMLVELIQEFVAKSPLLTEIHLIMNNRVKSIQLLTNLKRNELEKITHIRFPIKGRDDTVHLLNLAKSGLNKLKYICIECVYIPGGMYDGVEEQNLLDMLEYQKETLEYFKIKNYLKDQDSQGDTMTLPPTLPKLNVLKLAGGYGYRTNILDLNTRFPNLNEIDFTGERGFLSQFQDHDGPLIPCVQIKKLRLDNESFSRFDDADTRLSQWFPNVKQVKYNMAIEKCDDEHGRKGLWTLKNLEHLVLKVPLCLTSLILLSISTPFEFISGGIPELMADRPGGCAPNQLDQMKTSPNITWLTGLKSLKIKQRRRYVYPEGRDEGMCAYRYGYQVPRTELSEKNIGLNILSNMPDLEHFSSDLHCFSRKAIADLKMKILDFEPGRSIGHAQLYR